MQISFEIFPPKSILASFALHETVAKLQSVAPEFISVTCGTGGGNPAQTFDTLSAVADTASVPLAAHIPCAGQSRSACLAQARAYADAGITKVVALRGDAEQCQTTEPGFSDALEFTRALTQASDHQVYVAAYPETHPRATSDANDLDVLHQKQDAGAVAAITQFFMEAETFLRFRDKCDRKGITIPIIPGILPVSNWGGVSRMAALCGTEIAPDLATAFARAAREGRADLMALCHATEQCEILAENGVDHLHFYTLNRAQPCLDICRAMGLQPKTKLEKAA